MEILYAIIIILLFAVLAPLTQSKKRADSQKILSKKLADEHFEIKSIFQAGEMALYVDEKNGQWFWRRNQLDVLPAIYQNSMLAGFELLESGNMIAKADAGRALQGSIFSERREEDIPPRNGICSTLNLLIRFKGARYNEIVVPFLENSASRRSREYRKALHSALDIVTALLKIQESAKP